ncbi:MAG: tRNA-dihydrouridine synthase 3 [Alectoria sarmentosa]|nr:MAG: tRNA-dihydrouridine synthase 3 [Alectoria sarmentosa]
MAEMEYNNGDPPPNPLEPAIKLDESSNSDMVDKIFHPQHVPAAEDSAVTKAEKSERNSIADGVEESSSKRRKLDSEDGTRRPTQTERQKGVAPIKSEFLIHPAGSKGDNSAAVADDDAAEGAAHVDQRKAGVRGKEKEKSRGQNTNRNFGASRDEVGLCSSRASSPEFSPGECRFGDSCKFEHDLRKYLKDWKREDLTTFGGVCPIWQAKGKCDVGFKCRFVGSHMRERVLEDGRKELILTEEDGSHSEKTLSGVSDTGTINEISTHAKNDLMKRKFKTPRADQYNQWIEKSGKELEENARRDADNRACYTEPPFLPSEKRRIYFGPETPVLAPLTTQGNLPFRRLCVAQGAQVTYSEMAMSLPLIQGQKSEWALMRAHESEATAPSHKPQDSVVKAYNNAKDFKFGAQIAANKPWQALKATEILTQLCPYLRVIDLNCGCPIDLVYRTGAGSALLDSQGKLEKIVRGMNAVSGEIPITVKIRMGTKDNKPNALKLVDRLIYGGQEALEIGGGPSGAAAITLHGRSRQQRYTKNANWKYISECATLIKEYNQKGDDISDTGRETEEREQPGNGKVYFLGNGDCYSHVDYNTHLEEAKVDSVMIARGALIKPWIFEEIQQGQYLDKSASERLALVEQYARYGLETWGSDEMGIGVTRRFLLEWLSFAYRYVPVGILEHLPPSLQDRPPAWRGRNDLETLLGSDNYKDWIKISEMFLGPAHKDFNFQPKHKSNSYEIEAEG